MFRSINFAIEADWNETFLDEATTFPASKVEDTGVSSRGVEV